MKSSTGHGNYFESGRVTNITAVTNPRGVCYSEDMNVLYILLGALAGGTFGWLMGRRAAAQPEDCSATPT